jgi:hypothetical protein
MVVSLLNGTKLSVLFSEVAQTLGDLRDGVPGLSHRARQAVPSGRGLSLPLRPDMTRAAGDLLQYGERFIAHTFLIAVNRSARQKPPQPVDDHGATARGRTKSRRLDAKDEKISAVLDRKSSQRIDRLIFKGRPLNSGGLPNRIQNRLILTYNLLSARHLKRLRSLLTCPQLSFT